MKSCVVEDRRRVQSGGMGRNSHRLTTFTLVGLVNANANAVLWKPLQIIGSLKSERTYYNLHTVNLRRM
jgi:hypothetical protein